MRWVQLATWGLKAALWGLKHRYELWELLPQMPELLGNLVVALKDLHLNEEERTSLVSQGEELARQLRALWGSYPR